MKNAVNFTKKALFILKIFNLLKLGQLVKYYLRIFV